MKSYCGYDKPYIYVCCPQDKAEQAEEALSPLSDKGVLFCLGAGASRKELRRVEAAHAVMLFLTHDCVNDDDFHRVVNRAVQSGKNILTVYLDDVTLDSWGHMQLDSAYALFRSKMTDEDFVKKLSESEIFRDMAVTRQQKQFQKRRGFSLVAIPVLAAALIFATVVYPLLLAPVITEDDGSGIPGLKGLTQKELDQITELHICGDQVYTMHGKVHCWYSDGGRGEIGAEINNWITGENTQTAVNRGSITDLSDLEKLRNLEILEISGQQITDLTPVYKLKKLKKLGVECNPISSPEGIEALQNLEDLWISGTDVTDLTPLEALPRLHDLGIDGTYVRDLPNTETLERIYSFCACNSGVRMSYVGVHEGMSLDLRGLSYQLRDFSFLRDVDEFWNFLCTGIYAADFMPVLAGKPISEFCFSDIRDLTSLDGLDGLVVTRRFDICHTNSLTSIEGIEKYDGVEVICLDNCLGLTDLTPLNKLKNVKTVELCLAMKPLAEAQISPDACFEIVYRDE